MEAFGLLIAPDGDAVILTSVPRTYRYGEDGSMVQQHTIVRSCYALYNY